MDVKKQYRLMSFVNERVIHSVKTGLACLIGFAAMRVVHFPVDQWLVITIIVVMCAQINVGSVLQKSYMRFLGTLTGSLLAALTVIFFGTDPIIVLLIVSFAGALFSYVATSTKSYNETGTLGAVTTAIILIGKNPTVLTAVERFVEISIGILIAAVVSQFIFPVHARTRLRETQATTVRQLRSYYLATILMDQKGNHPMDYNILDEMIVKSLLAQRKLAPEAKRELLGKFSLDQFNQSLWCEKEILRAITFMHHAYKASPESKKLLSTMSLHQFNEQVCDALVAISRCLEKKCSAKKIILPDIIFLKEEVDHLVKNISTDDAVYANAFLFCAEILVLRMQKLIELIG